MILINPSIFFLIIITFFLFKQIKKLSLSSHALSCTLPLLTDPSRITRFPSSTRTASNHVIKRSRIPVRGNLSLAFSVKLTGAEKAILSKLNPLIWQNKHLFTLPKFSASLMPDPPLYSQKILCNHCFSELPLRRKKPAQWYNYHKSNRNSWIAVKFLFLVD